MSLGHLERDVMGCLWSAPAPLTVRDVHAALGDQRDVAYTTVMTVLQRLAKKGLARQTRDGKAHLYAAAETREEMAAEVMIDALGDVGGAQARQAALLHFVGRMSANETELLKAALKVDLLVDPAVDVEIGPRIGHGTGGGPGPTP